MTVDEFTLMMDIRDEFETAEHRHYYDRRSIFRLLSGMIYQQAGRLFETHLYYKFMFAPNKFK